MQATVDDLCLLVGAPEFDLRSAFDVEVAADVTLDRVVDECPHDVDHGGDLGQFETRVLQGEEWLPEHVALLDVRQRVVVGGLDRAQRGDAHDQALLRQLLHQLDEAAALDPAEQVLRRDAQFIEEQFGGVLPFLADLLQLATALESRSIVADLGGEQRQPGKLVRKTPLEPALFVPEPFSADRKSELEQRRMRAWATARRQPGKSTKLLIGVGEVKAIEPAGHGFKMQVRHLPGHPWYLEEDLYRKLSKRFAVELEHWQLAEAGDVRLIAITTFSVSLAGYANVEQLSLMTTDRNSLPFTGDADRTLLSTAVDQERMFRKVLAYNSSATAMASMDFTDTSPAVAAFIDRPAGDTDDDASIAGMPVWTWRTDEDMPDLPSPETEYSAPL